MRNFLSTTVFVLGLTAATSAEAGAGRWGEDLRFVAETTAPTGASGRTVSLCHLVDFADVLFVPIYTTLQSYALSNDGCTGEIYSELSTEHFAAMQAAGMIPADLPAVPSADLKGLLWGHAWLILGAIGVLFRVAGMLTGRSRRGPKAGKPDTLAIHSLVAMSQVAIADGRIDETETRQIAHILTRLTGKSYAPEQVSDLLNRLNPSPADIDQIGQDLSEKDRQIVLEAALNIAVADGEIHPNEYAVVSDLAQRMRIGADQFRSALARISAHLQTVHPA